MKLTLLFLLVTTSLFSLDRQNVPTSARWNLEALYPDFDAWHKEFEEVARTTALIDTYKTTVSQSPEQLYQILSFFEEHERKLDKLVVFARLSHDVNLKDTQAKQAYELIASQFHDFATRASWITPEILSLSDSQFAAYLAHPKLKNYTFALESIRRNKAHVLSAESEALIALSGAARTTSEKAFSSLTDAEFMFNHASDSTGNLHPVSQATYPAYLQSNDPILRKNAFNSLHNKYFDHQNTLAELLSGKVHSHLFYAKAKNYSSCLEAALHPKGIDTSVYTTLIHTVRSRVDLLQNYLTLRKKILGATTLYPHDLYAPLFSPEQKKYTYDEAVTLVLEAVKPLGNTYQEILARGLREERWVDWHANDHKRSGAYSSGCYDSMPYMLMSFDGTLSSVITLAHEAGHSMHSYFSRTHQSYTYERYDHFVAEVASLFNEELVFKHLLAKAKNKQEKAYLLSQALDRLRASLFRQTIFAEFELYVHELAEKNIPITAGQLSEKYRELMQFYYGDQLTCDDVASIEWARIPHFYSNFYVYQYATGMSAAIALNKKVLECDDAKKRYLSFLQSGGSDYSLNLLAKAGVDMRTSDPIHTACDRFAQYLAELTELNLDKLS